MDIQNPEILEQVLYFVLSVGAVVIGLFMGGMTIFDKLKSYLRGKE